MLEGHFELRSGLHSDRFFQCANVLQHPPEAEELCRALAQRLRAGMDAGGVQAQSVIAPALGGVVVGHEVARALGLRSIFVEKQEGRLALRRFEIEAGERFIVAEDVVTRVTSERKRGKNMQWNAAKFATVKVLNPSDKQTCKTENDIPL